MLKETNIFIITFVQKNKTEKTPITTDKPKLSIEIFDPDTGELVQQGSTLEYEMYNNNEELHLQCASDQHTSLNRDIFPVWYKNGKVVGMFV